VNFPIRFQKFVLSALFALSAVPALLIPANAEIIRSFDSSMQVSKDGLIDITETINMDFESAYRHGIYRMIPVRYKRYNNTYTTPLRVLSVTCDGEPAKYDVSDQDNDINIKIGDPQSTISGAHKYSIHYTVRRAINFLDKNEPEIYWNVTGNEWPFTIESMQTHVALPSGVDYSSLRTATFVGTTGSQTPGEPAEVTSGAVTFKADNLEPGSGFTFAIKLPEGSIAKPSVMGDLIWLLCDWWPAFVFPGLTFALMYSFWWYSGRDPASSKIAGIEWSPPKDFSPAEVGTLVDEHCDMSDIVSTIIDLAARGYLKIKELEPTSVLFSSKDYRFTKLREGNDLKQHEQLVFNGLFAEQGIGATATLADLKYKFSAHLPAIRDAVYSSLTTQRYFTENPDRIRKLYYAICAILGFIGIVVLIEAEGLSWGIGMMAAALFVGIFARRMPAKTMAGVQACRECLGFKRFVHKAEKDRIRVLAKEDPTIFGRLLPFAMVLGAADLWAARFHDLLVQPPNWYEPYGWGPNYVFSPTIFVNDLGSGMQAMDHTLSAVESAESGGSGFSGGGSGGGFGGGGGGSW